MPERKILFVLTGAGFQFDLVTPAGGPAPIAPGSRETDEPDAA